MDFKKIKKELPVGAIRKIISRTGIGKSTVYGVLSGKISSPQEATIFQAVAEYLAEYKQEKRDARKALQTALKA